MRIATAHSYDTSIANLQKRQQDLADAQLRLTSGKRVGVASDDPVAAGRAERALAVEQRVEATKRAVEASRNAMTLAESALGDATSVLQSAREAIVAAGNGTYSDKERQSLALQLQQYRDQLLGIANRRDGAGTPLFAGQGADGDPFVDVAGTVVFNGVPGAMGLASGEVLPATVDGRYAWMSAASGNGYFETGYASSNTGAAWIDPGTVTDRTQATATQGSSYELTFSIVGGTTVYNIARDGVAVAPADRPYQSGTAITIDGKAFTISGAPAPGDRFTVAPSTPDLTVFDALDRTIAALKQPMSSSAQVSQAVSFGLRDLDGVMERLQSARAAVGDTLNRIDAVTGRLDALDLNAKTDRSNAEDLDMIAAISDFQNKQTGYDAALKTYAQVQRLSLFDYLR